jgi:hypothetical protein
MRYDRAIELAGQKLFDVETRRNCKFSTFNCVGAQSKTTYNDIFAISCRKP